VFKGLLYYSPSRGDRLINGRNIFLLDSNILILQKNNFGLWEYASICDGIPNVFARKEH
jgi:hypothetical protein